MGANESYQPGRLALRVKKFDDERCGQTQKNRHHEDINRGKDEAVRQHLAHPRNQLGAEVVPHDRTDRSRQSEKNAEGHGIEPVNDGKGCDGRFAKMRKYPHCVGIGNRRRQIGQDGRNDDCHHRREIQYRRLAVRLRDKIMIANGAVQSNGHDNEP
jgi:hypothetical protein